VKTETRGFDLGFNGDQRGSLQMEELANTAKNVAWLSETGVDPGGYHMVLMAHVILI
jgi:hypothetical protein